MNAKLMSAINKLSGTPTKPAPGVDVVAGLRSLASKKKSETKSSKLPVPPPKHPKLSATADGLDIPAALKRKPPTKEERDAQIARDAARAVPTMPITNPKSMPLSGKAALKAIADAAIANGHPVTKVPQGATQFGYGPKTKKVFDTKSAWKTNGETTIKAKVEPKAPAKVATKPAPKASAKVATAKPPKSKKTSGPSLFEKTKEHASRAVQMMKRKDGATSLEMQKAFKWDGYITRVFVRDVVRNPKRMGLNVITSREGGETRYTIA